MRIRRHTYISHRTAKKKLVAMDVSDFANHSLLAVLGPKNDWSSSFTDHACFHNSLSMAYFAKAQQGQTTPRITSASCSLNRRTQSGGQKHAHRASLPSLIKLNYDTGRHAVQQAKARRRKSKSGDFCTANCHF